MARTSILSDELVHQLVAVGQVDVLVGVPTFNNAATVGKLVTALHVGLARHFPRERTALVNPDGGSDDGTVDAVRNAPMADEELRASATLRTTHRASAVYPGLPGRAAGVRAVLAAADLLQARVVLLVDPDVTTLTPEWVGALARPAWKDEAEVVLPVHARHRFEGPLLAQLVRPLLGAAYGRRMGSNLAGAFACSGRFAARVAVNGPWDAEPSRAALDVWLVATALAEELRMAEVHLGPCAFAPRAGRAGLAELFEQVVGMAFTCLDRDAPAWLSRTEMHDVPVLGQPVAAPETDAVVDVGPMAERFRTGVRDLAPVLRDIVAAGTLARLQAAASSGEDVPRVPDPLWVTTVYEFAAAAHRAVMHREHLAQALVPIYLGRTASYFAEIATADEAAQHERLAALEREYALQRQFFVECWNADGGR